MIYQHEPKAISNDYFPIQSYSKVTLTMHDQFLSIVHHVRQNLDLRDIYADDHKVSSVHVSCTIDNICSYGQRILKTFCYSV